MGTINKQPARFELTAVYRHPEAKADIVLVHGLNGNPQRTWTAPNGVYWPTDLLPTSLKNEHANILVYGYNADVFSTYWTRHERNPSDNYIHLHAQSLVTTLTHYRKSEGTERNPIIWVVHSLGGILTKSALLYSNDVRAHHQEDLRSIFVSTYGLIFLGTPHNGSDAAAWGRIIQRMVDSVVPRKIFETESVLLKTLKKDNEALQQISNHFMDIYQRFRIHMAHENHKTDVKGSKILVVDSSSAGPQLPGVTYYGIEATHSGMCKFESDTAPGYRTVSTALREWVADAPHVIPIRWEVEEDDRRLRANLENMERVRPYQGPALITAAAAQQQQITAEGNNELLLHHVEAAQATAVGLLPEPAPAHDTPKLLPAHDTPKLLPDRQEPQAREEHEPLFIHPETFRPNSFFVGREDELRGLHEMLMDRKRRSEGTSAVLIQCLPGGGKTHLARQYVFQHRDDYPGGVYWVRAKSRHELEYWFLRIARNEMPSALVDQRNADELRDPKKIIQLVRRWLSAQSHWLMVFDGVQFDTPGLHEFIPDARNTSLIYTSTERAVTGDPRFDNPQVMELGLLTAQQAQDLLLLEMERKKPWSADDQAMALELVQLMGQLPLMIHVAAQHLKATREPLARYLKSYKNRPKAGHLPAYKAVREQLENRGETAALNLISLLVFFDQHIPVEMLALGLSALDKVTPVKTYDASHRKANLNNTLRILIAFALIGRSESDDMSPSSSRSSKRSFDKQVEYLDLLRIHSVVQAFFIDSLHEQRQLPFWLERATAIWCRSYDEADRRIREDSRVGLPDDYRRFAIHGQKLRQNLDKFEKRYPGLAKVRSQLEQRLGKIQGQIDQLSHAIRRNVSDSSGRKEHPASVFDRISTSSQSDASATLQSESSQLSWVASVGEGDPAELVQSPVVEILEEDMPYPTTPLMPDAPEILGYDDDQETIILSAAGTQLYIGGTESVELAHPAQDHHGSFPQPSAYEDWEDAIPHHRVIRRQETRRYHDRAGAWRDKTISDPRVGLSREVAVGSVSSKREASRSPLGARLTAQSEAEMELNKIKRAAPPSPRGGRGSFGSGTSSRPNVLLGRNSWALPQAQKTPDNEVAQILPQDFSSGLGQVLSSPKSWTEATLQRLKKTVLPSTKVPKTPPLSQGPAEEDNLTPPGPIFRGSRSVNSSPASNASPFPPPSFAAIPTEDLMAPPTGLPLVVRRWDTVVYQPDGTPVSSSGIEWASTPDPMSQSFPTLMPHTHTHHHHQPRPPPQFFLRGGPAAGYSSQPMSRDGSHQSNPSINISSSPAQASPPSRPPSPPSHPHPLSHSLPLHQPQQQQQRPSQPIPTPAAPASAVPAPGSHLTPSQFIRPRASSYTETEPSPRLGTPFSDIDTSYHRWEQHHRQGPAATRAGAGVGAGVGTLGERIGSFPVNSGAALGSSGSGSGSDNGSVNSRISRWRAVRGTRIIRGRSGSGSRRRGSFGSWKGKRAKSLSPPSGSPNPRARAVGGNLHHHVQQHQHHPLAEWSTPPEGSGLGAGTGPAELGVAAGGEAMSRSGSGGSTGAGAGGGGGAAGIMVGDGAMVVFGSPVINGGGGSVGTGGRGRAGSLPGMGGNGLGILE